MRKALLAGGVLLLGLGIVGISSAFAATKSPGLLRVGDVPGSFQQYAAPIAYTETTLLAVDAQACTETLQPIASPVGGVEASFVRVGAPAGSLTLIEAVLVFPNAKAAASTFALVSKDHAARLKCTTVGFIPQGSTTSGAPTMYQEAKFPKIGAGSYLESSGAPGTVDASAVVTFVSGPYLVRLGTFGTDPITTTEFQKIAPRALKRLPVPTPIPPTTTTTP